MKNAKITDMQIYHNILIASKTFDKLERNAVIQIEDLFC